MSRTSEVVTDKTAISGIPEFPVQATYAFPEEQTGRAQPERTGNPSRTTETITHFDRCGFAVVTAVDCWPITALTLPALSLRPSGFIVVL